jgi:hypothetical protein
MFSACMSGSFDKQKFTGLKHLSSDGYVASIIESEQDLDDTLISPYSIELTLNNSIKADAPLYIETGEKTFRFEQPRLDMKDADVCGKKLVPVLSKIYPKNAAIIYAEEDNIVDDTCIYISDIDEVLYQGEISQQVNTKINHNKTKPNGNYGNEHEQSTFPFVWLILLLIGVLFGVISYIQYQNALASNDCLIQTFGALMFLAVAIIFGFITFVFLLFFVYYLAKFAEYNKKRKRA